MSHHRSCEFEFPDSCSESDFSDLSNCESVCDNKKDQCKKKVKKCKRKCKPECKPHCEKKCKPHCEKKCKPKCKPHCKPECKPECKPKSGCHRDDCKDCDPYTSPLNTNITATSSFPTLPTISPGIIPGTIAIGAGGFIFIGSSQQRQIYRANPDGTNATLFATIPTTGIVMGVAIGPDGFIYVLGGSPGEVWRLSQSGGVATLYASTTVSFGSNIINGLAITFNDLILDRMGNIYITDSAGGRVFKVNTSGVITLFSDSPLLKLEPNSVPIYDNVTTVANGIAFSSCKEKSLYISVTATGRIVEIPILKNGSAGTVTTVVSSAKLIGVDGITLDSNGFIWATIATQNKIYRINPECAQILLALDVQYPIVDYPVSIKFVNNKPGDCKLTAFFTGSSAIRGNPVGAQFPFFPGAPNPRLWRLDIQYGNC
jgi:sugar lactone lactonase YvrE